MDGGDAVLVGELAHKTKPADTASETSSLPEQKGFRGFVLLDTQDFTGELNFAVKCKKTAHKCCNFQKLCLYLCRRLEKGDNIEESD